MKEKLGRYSIGGTSEDYNDHNGIQERTAS